MALPSSSPSLEEAPKWFLFSTQPHLLLVLGVPNIVNPAFFFSKRIFYVHQFILGTFWNCIEVLVVTRLVLR